ncbi:MAG: IS256 family transposase [Anaerolineales bacterium]
MKNNTTAQTIQAQLDALTQQLANDPIMNSLAGPEDLQTYLQAGFSALLNATLLKERAMYLDENPDDRGNGFAPPRQLHVKTTPVNIERPRSRNGFYPAILPKHQRHVPSDYQQLLEQVLLEARSFRSGLRTLQAMGLSYSPKELEALLEELEKEARMFHSRPLDPDWLVLYIDAKVLDLKDEHDQVKKAVHFLVIGVNGEARKEVLSSRIFWGNEVLECWRQVFTELKNRGLTRFLLLLTDDFSGLKKLVAGFWPHSDHQLCTVHLLRNARRQLAPEHYTLFTETWRQLCAASSIDTAREQWLGLLDQLREHYPAWIAHLQSRTDNYLQFMNYPSTIRRNLRSTNLPEGINNLIETLRRNAGGHFHSEREVRIKMKLLIDRLASGKWKQPNPMIKYYLPILTRMFQQRFEDELTENYFLTPNI